jgi:hypothetical protein
MTDYFIHGDEGPVRMNGFDSPDDAVREWGMKRGKQKPVTVCVFVADYVGDFRVEWGMNIERLNYGITPRPTNPDSPSSKRRAEGAAAQPFVASGPIDPSAVEEAFAEGEIPF